MVMPLSASPHVHCINPDCPSPNRQTTWGNNFCQHCGAPLRLNNRYLPLEPLGKGGFATIYTVYDLETNTERVLKVLVATLPKALELFEQEAAVLKSLHHPGVPRVEPDGYFQVNLGRMSQRELPCLVMEKINGQTLEDILKEHPQGCPEALVLQWLKQVVDILEELHRRQIIHRDLKPSNLMLRQETGQVVVIDFGGAKQIGEVQFNSQSTSTRLLSEGYSPPEQIAGTAVGAAADFYALGRTCIHLLTGKEPSQLVDRKTGELHWRTIAQVSPVLANLLDNMVREEVEQRPATATDINNVLKEIYNVLAVKQSNPEAHPQFKAFQQKRNTLISLIQRQKAVLHSLNMTGWESTIQDLEERVLTNNFKVLVVGEFKRGKSTFINALLGEEVLPAYATPCTAIINEVKWGEAPKVLLHFAKNEDGLVKPPVEIPIEELEEYVVIKEDVSEIHTTPYQKVELFWPLELCHNGVEIIDSPGLNESDIRRQITVDYLSTVDAVLFVLSCEALASQSELSFIDNNLRDIGHEDIFFICNRFDLIRRKEQDRIREFGISKLAPRTKLGKEGVFFISAFEALEGRLDEDDDRVEKSGILQIERELENFLTTQRGKIKILQPANKLKWAIREASRIIPERQDLLQTDLRTLEKRYEAAQEPLQQLENTRKNIVQRISNFRDDIKDLVRQKARNFYQEIAGHIEEWVDSYQLKKPFELVDVVNMQTAVTRVVDELSEYLYSKVEAENATWQRDTLQPFLTSRLEDLIRELDDRAVRFGYEVDKLRFELEGKSITKLSVEMQDTHILERILAAVGGYVLAGGDIVSAAMGAAFGYQEVLKSIAIHIAIVTGVHVVAGFNPLILIPAILAGGFAQGLMRINATNEKIKKSVGKKYVEEIRSSAYQRSEEIAETIGYKLDDIRQAVDRELAKEIQGVREQVESILVEKQKGQTNVDQKLRELSAISQELSEINHDLDGLIYPPGRPPLYLLFGG